MKEKSRTSALFLCYGMQCGKMDGAKAEKAQMYGRSIPERMKKYGTVVGRTVYKGD